MGLLEPSLVKSDLRLHAWRLTENGKEYVRAINAMHGKVVQEVFQQMSPEEVEQVVATVQKVSSLTWAGMKAAVGMTAIQEKQFGQR
jgi:DNA-binding MarR family transcriptional regulator